jgi:hypothetical protein
MSEFMDHLVLYKLRQDDDKLYLLLFVADYYINEEMQFCIKF